MLQVIERLHATRTSSCLVILVGEPHQGQLDLITSLASTRPAGIALTVLQLGQAAFDNGNDDWLVVALADGLSSLPTSPLLVAFCPRALSIAPAASVALAGIAAAATASSLTATPAKVLASSAAASPQQTEVLCNQVTTCTCSTCRMRCS